MADENSDIWEKMGPASFQVDGGEQILFLVLDVTDTGGNRIAPRKRPYQRGVKLDTTGAKEGTIEITAPFHNDLSEPGIEGTVQLYPNRLDALIAAMATGKTGTLHLPWKRNLRVKGESWRRHETSADMRGGAVLSITFIEDNEDNLDREAFERVSVKANVAREAIIIGSEMEAMGSWDGSLADIQEFASNLAALLNAPSEYAGTILQAATSLRRSILTVFDAINANAPGVGALGGAEGADTRIKLLGLLELAAGAIDSSRESMPKTRTVTFRIRRDLSSVAAEFKQPYRDLLTINESIEDPNDIPPFTPVKILVS